MESIVDLMNAVIDGQHPVMLKRPNSLKILAMSSKAFDGYTKQLQWMFPNENVGEIFLYRGINIDVFKSEEIYIAISIAIDKKQFTPNPEP